MTHISFATLDTCHTARGLVVVIDVIRAFTTAAYAFAAGAQQIVPVGTLEKAREWQQRLPNAVLMGEAGGLRPPGFHYGNSPAALRHADLQGRTVIQRTGFGTQGLVRSVAADTLLAASFACAGATARFVAQCCPAAVTLVSTGMPPEGAEDDACAAYLAGLLGGSAPDVAPLLDGVRCSVAGRMFTDQLRPGFDPADLPCCAALDTFDFAMPVRKSTAAESRLFGKETLVIEALPC